MTKEEFKAKYLTLSVQERDRNEVNLSTVSVPASMDWVELGYLNSVKD